MLGVSVFVCLCVCRDRGLSVVRCIVVSSCVGYVHVHHPSTHLVSTARLPTHPLPRRPHHRIQWLLCPDPLVHPPPPPPPPLLLRRTMMMMTVAPSTAEGCACTVSL